MRVGGRIHGEQGQGLCGTDAARAAIGVGTGLQE